MTFMPKLAKLLRLTTSFILAIALEFPQKAQANLSGQQVIQGVTAGINYIHGNKAKPRVYYNIPRGFRSPCGQIDPYNAGYCPRSHSIYIGRGLQNIAYYKYGDAALAYLLAHEYAHGMQRAFRFQPGVTVLSELQADCLAGVYLAAIPNIIFDDNDLQEIVRFAYDIGGYEVWSPDWHGTPEMRVKSVVIGLRSGRVESCEL
jgi:predicted metalloprotease